MIQQKIKMYFRGKYHDYYDILWYLLETFVPAEIYD